MSAFLKIDRCSDCHRELPWEWIPPIHAGARTLAGTGVWRSTLTDGLCPICFERTFSTKDRLQQALQLRQRFIRMVGIAPYREFTFDRYRLNAGNRLAFDRAKGFDPSKGNLYLWGPNGAGKTHLATAILRRWFTKGAAVFVTAGQLIRKARMRSPEDEQRVIDEVVQARLVVLDELGPAQDSPFCRQILQEILDGRRNQDRAGLVVTSLLSPQILGRRMGHAAVASRLAAMCEVIEIRPKVTPEGSGRV